MPVVGGEWGNVAHENGIELPDIDAEFECGRTDECVDGLGIGLEEVFQSFPFVMGHHGGVFFGAEHGVALIEQLEVVAIGVFGDVFEFAVAAPGEAEISGGTSSAAAAAVSAAIDAAVGLESQSVSVYLIEAAGTGYGVAFGATEGDGMEQSAFHEELKQAAEEVFHVVGFDAPLAGSLFQDGFAAITEPLCDECSFVL